MNDATDPAAAFQGEQSAEAVNTYPERFKRKTTGISTLLVTRELKERNISYGPSKQGIAFKRPDGRRAFFRGGTLSCNTSGANAICLNKEATKAFLRVKGIPLARSDLFSANQREDALRYAGFLGYPVVLKRVGGMGGAGVWPNIPDENALALIWNSSVKRARSYMVEKHASGEDHRFLVADGAVIAALHRQPASIIGDGLHSVAALIESRNALRASTNNPVHKPVALSSALRALEAHGLTPEHVPQSGQRILLQFTANISSGGDAVDVTDGIPEVYKDLAIRSVRAVPGLRVGGVDIIIRDVAANRVEGNCTILEINHNPMLSMHHFPWIGKPRNVAGAIVDILLGTRHPLQAAA